MNPELWQRAKEIYNSVLERQPVQREAFIAEACAGDEALRKEVESMLGWQEKAGDFIESPALEVAGKAMAEGMLFRGWGIDLAGARIASAITWTTESNSTYPSNPLYTWPRCDMICSAIVEVCQKGTSGTCLRCKLALQLS